MLRWIFAALLLATPLGAACPQASDMRKGVVFRTSDGNLELHRRMGSDWVQIVTRFPEGDGTIMEFDRGIYLHSSAPSDRPNQRTIFGSKANLKAWADPQPGAKWRNETEDGGRARAEALKSLRVGDCRLSGFEVTIDFAEERYREVYFYLVDLETGLLIESDDGKTKERYRYTGIGLQP